MACNSLIHKTSSTYFFLYPEKAVREREAKTKRDEEEKISQNRKAKKHKLEEIRKEFMALVASSESPQKRGFAFEQLFFDVLELEHFEYTKPYKKSGEQIDGHLRYEKFDYLVEIKWIKGRVKQKDLSTFDGKIRGKMQSTRGLFIATNGFDDNAIQKFSGDSPRILFMDGQDLMCILDGRITFTDCLKGKVDALVRRGDVLFRPR